MDSAYHKEIVERESIILDCDPGIDDAVAIFVAQHRAHLKGITTVGGNVPLDLTTRNALAVVELIDRDVPVYAGIPNPRVAQTKRASTIHGADGLGGVVLPQPTQTLQQIPAVEYLLNQVQSSDWVVATGPLTNIAAVLAQDSSWCRRIGGLSIMGGSATYGNITAAAEFNIYADPEAASLVFQHGQMVKLCGLNLTHQLVVTDERLKAIEQIQSDQSVFVQSVLKYSIDRMESLSGVRAAPLHDPCAVLAVTDADLFDFEPMCVEVETQGQLTRGMTVIDQRTTRPRKPPNTRVALKIDAAAAWNRILTALN